MAAASKAAGAAGADPVLAPWTGPYGGVPPFGKIKVSMFPAAFQASMDEDRAELKAIAENPAAPTYENTIAALEDAGRTLGRVFTLWGIHTSTLNAKDVQALDREWQPRFAAFQDEYFQNTRLFARIEALYTSPAKASWSAEQQRLVWKYYTDFVRQGAKLDAGQKKQLSDYNLRLATLYTQFSQNQLADEESERLVLESADDLEGLPKTVAVSYATLADEKGLKGKWAVANTRSAMEPFLTYADRRDLREKAFRMWTRRGDYGGEHDNNRICSEILLIRARRAKLLGFPTHAHWRLENAMAKTPENAM